MSNYAWQVTPGIRQLGAPNIVKSRRDQHRGTTSITTRLSNGERLDSFRGRNVARGQLSFSEECIRTSPLFRGLSPIACGELADASRERSFRGQQTIFRQDDPIRYVDVIASGSVKITQLSHSGKEVILRVDQTGNPIDSIAKKYLEVHTISAHTIRHCSLLSWDVNAFAVFLDRFPIIHRNATEIIAKRLKNLEQRFCDVATKRVPQRVARVLLDLAESHGSGGPESIGLSREELAQMTGTSLFTVSRLLSEWSEQEIVHVTRRSLVIEQLPRLKELAEDPAELFADFAGEAREAL